MEEYGIRKKCDTRIDALFKQYDDVLNNELPKGLAPKRAVDREVDIEETSSSSHGPLFKLSPVSSRIVSLQRVYSGSAEKKEDKIQKIFSWRFSILRGGQRKTV